MLSNNYEDQDLLPLMLPIVQQNLDQQDWRLRESAILALGAVSEGCHMGMSSYIEGEAQHGGASSPGYCRHLCSMGSWCLSLKLATPGGLLFCSNEAG